MNEPKSIARQRLLTCPNCQHQLAGYSIICGTSCSNCKAKLVCMPKGLRLGRFLLIGQLGNIGVAALLGMPIALPLSLMPMLVLWTLLWIVSCCVYSKKVAAELYVYNPKDWSKGEMLDANLNVLATIAFVLLL